jgi:DNA-binding FadR family transcriptional regulator
MNGTTTRAGAADALDGYLPEFNRVPLFAQTRNAMIELIRVGKWQAGMILPNEHVLGRQLGISAGTVRKALELLMREHFIERKPGRGTTVARPLDWSELPTTSAGVMLELIGSCSARRDGRRFEIAAQSGEFFDAERLERIAAGAKRLATWLKQNEILAESAEAPPRLQAAPAADA